MKIKHLIPLTILLASTISSHAQQVNPVPDYVFRNQMSVGRNAVTDTAAYFSIGPRYGATKGFMPPIVGDTATFSSGKRNGLLIFSVQKNKFLYWDSVGVKWAEMAGTGGSAITGSGVAGYMPEFTTTTNLDTTRLYHSAGRFAIGSTTTTNGVFNVYGGQSYFDSSLKVSTIFNADDNKSEIYINTLNDTGSFSLQVNGGTYLYPNSSGVNLQMHPGQSIRTAGTLYNDFATTGTGDFVIRYGSSFLNAMQISNNGEVRFNNISDQGAFAVQLTGGIYIGSSGVNVQLQSGRAIRSDGTVYMDAGTSGSGEFVVRTGASFNTAMFISSSQETLINTGTDAGDYKLQVAGNIYNTGSITTGAPTSGTAKPWKIGEAATVSPTSPNRTIRVEIDGTVYYLHAKTTND